MKMKMQTKLKPNISSQQHLTMRMQMRRILVITSIAISFIAITLTSLYFFTDIKILKGMATVSAVQSGNWSDAATWSTGSIPASTDDVTIGSGYTITLNSDYSCASLNITAPSANGTSQLTVAVGKTLTVSGNVSLTGGSTNSRDANIVFSGTGSKLDINGNLSFSSAAAQRCLVDMSTNASQLNLAGSFSITGAISWNAGTASIINFDGSSAQTVPISSGLGFNDIYFNNTSATGATVDANITAQIIGGNIRVQTGTFDNGGYSIAGSNSKTFEIANGATFTLKGSSSLPSGFGNTTMGASSTTKFDGNGVQTISAANYGNLTSSNIGDRTFASSGTIGVAGTFTPGSNSYTITGSTIDYISSGSQNITAFNYNNLSNSGNGLRTLPSSGTIRVAGAFSSGTGAYTVTGSTFDYNGTGTAMNAQTIIAFDYNNLTSSSTGDRVLASTGTIGINGTFTPGTNVYTNTGSTIEFKSSSAQNIPAFNYNNLISSGIGARTLASSGTIGIASTFTPGGNTYTTTGSTVNFNGSSSQVIPTFSFNNVTVSNSSGASLSGDVTLPGDMVISGSLNGGGGVITVKGAWTNNGTFTHGSNEVVLSGTSVQAIGGSAATTFNNLKIDNSSGVSLSVASTVVGVLNLTSGKIATTATNLLTLETGATVSGGSSLAFINGPVAKKTNSTTVFTFPIGKNSTFMKLGIEPTITNATTFTAEFFDDTAATYNTNSKGAGITNISKLEYFQLDRSGTGTKADAKVTLYWDVNSLVTAGYLADLRVCRWNGTQWEDKGNSTYTGDATSGSVTSNVITSFSPFSLGSSSSNNPLPIKLLSFNALPVSNGIEINWITASEENNDFFTIERSLDGINSEIITTVDGAGNSNSKLSYSYIDENPESGISYYRLKQTDFDGKFEYFNWVKVEWNAAGAFAFESIGPNPCKDNLKINFNSPDDSDVKVSLIAMNGKVVYEEVHNTVAGNNEINITSVANMDKGIYLVYLNNNNKIISKKLLKTE